MIGNGFQHADAEEHERQDIRARFGLTGDRLDRFAGDDTVADGRAERDAGDDDAERQQGKRRLLTLQESRD